MKREVRLALRGRRGPDLDVRRRIQFPAVGKAFHQVGIAQVRPTKGDEKIRRAHVVEIIEGTDV